MDNSKKTTANIKQVSPICPKPLTRRSSEGELYIRPPEVESQIKSALLLDRTSFLEKACIQDRNLKDFLKEECLVYMIRHYHDLGDREMVSNLFKELMSRCVEFIHKHQKSLGQRAEDAFREVIANLTDKLLDLESDRGDFFQARFWLGLKRLTLTEFNKQIREMKKEEKTFSLSNQKEGPNGPEMAIEIQDESMSQEEIAMCKEGLAVLKYPYNEVFILRYYSGWPIDSNDPDKVTLSSHFKVTPRTIRNWLNKAEETLKKWRKGKKS